MKPVSKLVIFMNYIGAFLAVLLLLGPAMLVPGSALEKPPDSARISIVSGTWRAPTQGKLRVLRAFFKPAQRWDAGHRGVDLAAESNDAAVLAPADGTVVFAGKVVDRTVIVLEHANGLRSSFEPVTDPLPVDASVKAGDTIAHLDPEKPHCESTPCLHWGVRRGGDKENGSGKNAEYINPLSLLGNARPSILLPVDESFTA